MRKLFHCFMKYFLLKLDVHILYYLNIYILNVFVNNNTFYKKLFKMDYMYSTATSSENI